MKKILVTLLAILTAATMAFAVPALPGPFKYKQPDGSVIVLELHGDEYFHWTTDASGQTVEKGADGFYRPVDSATFARRARAARTARAQANARRARWSSYDNPPATNFGVRKILCILAEFQPETEAGRDFVGKYTVQDPNQHFSNMLNQQGYNLNGTTGSVRDYFVDNSLAQYKPQFDVYGPVTLSQTESYYDQNGDDKAIVEAIGLLSSQISLADYDTDNNGEVDMVLFYFPGYNEAEHGPDWTIWPHQVTGYWDLGERALTRYFCTSELRGNSGTELASIGTTCHEFSHALGLPDFYDVDYAENGQNGFTTGFYDLMGSGNYNNDGRTPPALSAVERNMLGWMDYPETITTSGNYTLQGVQNNKAYRIDTRQTGECFILESRGGDKWDSYLRDMYAYGMIVYHIDKTNNVVPNSGLTAAYLWENTNSINAYGGHPCYYIVPASDNAQYTNDYPFGGYNNVKVFEPEDWNGDSAGIQLSNIAYNDGTVTFRADVSGSRMIFGHVKGVDGAPVPNATVILSRASHAFEAPAVLSTDQTCETDAEGYYSFTLAENASVFQVVSTRKDGYVAQAYNVLVSGLFTEVDFVLMAQGQAPPATLKKYDESQTMYGYRLSGPSSLAVGVHYTAAELAEMGAIGSVLTSISFASAASSGESIYLVVDIGNEMTLRQEVTSQYQANTMLTFDVSDKNIVIPDGKDLYVGYGYTPLYSNSNYYPILGYDRDDNSSVEGGNYVLANFQSSTSWQAYGALDYVVSAVLSRASTIDFASYGVSYIKLVNGVPEVVPAAGKTVYSVTWYVDETAVNGTPPAVSTLASGKHTYKAVLQHYDGTSERVYYDVNKE